MALSRTRTREEMQEVQPLKRSRSDNQDLAQPVVTVKNASTSGRPIKRVRLLLPDQNEDAAATIPNIKAFPAPPVRHKIRYCRRTQPVYDANDLLIQVSVEGGHYNISLAELPPLLVLPIQCLLLTIPSGSHSPQVLRSLLETISGGGSKLVQLCLTEQVTPQEPLAEALFDLTKVQGLRYWMKQLPVQVNANLRTLDIRGFSILMALSLFWVLQDPLVWNSLTDLTMMAFGASAGLTLSNILATIPPLPKVTSVTLWIHRQLDLQAFTGLTYLELWSVCENFEVCRTLETISPELWLQLEELIIVSTSEDDTSGIDDVKGDPLAHGINFFYSHLDILLVRARKLNPNLVIEISVPMWHEGETTIHLLLPLSAQAPSAECGIQDFDFVPHMSEAAQGVATGEDNGQ